jgi:uncharacterized protein YoxC
MKKLALLLVIAVAFVVIGCQPPAGSVVTPDQLDAVKAELSALKTDVDGLKAMVDSLTAKCVCAGKGSGTVVKPPPGGGTVKPPIHK